MKIRLVKEGELLCPYVVCSACDRAIKAGELAHAIRGTMVGDVEVEARHDFCEWPDRALSRPLGEYLTQLMNNSVQRGSFLES